METISAIFTNKFVILLMTLILFAIIVKIMDIVVNKIFKNLPYTDNPQRVKQLQTIKQIIQSTILAVFIVIALLQAMTTFGIDIKPLIATAGVAGVAIGFGAKRFVEDLIMGVLVLSEGQINVGDYVEIAGLKGNVEKISLKMIVLRDTSGQVHYIRNGLITTVTNYTQNYGYNILTVAVPHDSNVESVYDAMRQVYADMKNNPEISKMILSDIEILGVDRIVQTVIYTLCKVKTTSGSQATFKNQFNQRIKEKLDVSNIKLISTLSS
ncbi:MAG: mechanosensitive ion channel [Candidatus Gastranaerophilales bacterium]|nr:mechanosensitive ion channel [Candidatus Gastranaerophilales bacterium]